jgi:hypothetical protein
MEMAPAAMGGVLAAIAIQQLRGIGRARVQKGIV